VSCNDHRADDIGRLDWRPRDCPSFFALIVHQSSCYKMINHKFWIAVALILRSIDSSRSIFKIHSENSFDFYEAYEIRERLTPDRDEHGASCRSRGSFAGSTPGLPQLDEAPVRERRRYHNISAFLRVTRGSRSEAGHSGADRSHSISVSHGGNGGGASKSLLGNLSWSCRASLVCPFVGPGPRPFCAGRIKLVPRRRGGRGWHSRRDGHLASVHFPQLA